MAKVLVLYSGRSAISRAIVAIVIVLLIVVAAVAYVEVSKPASTTTTSSTSSSSTTSSSSLPTSLTIDEASVPTSMDPGAVEDNNGLEVAQNTNLTLFFCAKKNTACTALVPVVVQTITGSANGLNYSVTLRTDVYYNNGDPLNAY